PPDIVGFDVLQTSARAKTLPLRCGKNPGNPPFLLGNLTQPFDRYRFLPASEGRTVATGARQHPDLILMEVYDGQGFGHTYLSQEDFDYAADHFMLPAVKYASADVSDPEQRRELAYDFLWRYFSKPDAKGYFRENVRWIAAAAVREKFA